MTTGHVAFGQDGLKRSPAGLNQYELRMGEENIDMFWNQVLFSKNN